MMIFDEGNGDSTCDTIRSANSMFHSNVLPARGLVPRLRLRLRGWVRLGLRLRFRACNRRCTWSTPADSVIVVYLEGPVHQRLMFPIAAECENGDGRADDLSTAR